MSIMDNKKRDEIIKRYEELPEDIQKAYFSSATSDAIFEVGKKHGLVIEKMGELADETGLVMLGMTKPTEYIRNLEKRLDVEATKAKEIAEDINQKVFSPIRESLKKIHGIPPSHKAAGKQIPPTPPTTPISVSPIKPPSVPIPQVKPVSPPISPPENLPVESKSPPQKIVMPEQPINIKVGEIGKPTEPKVEIEPIMKGRIQTSSPTNPVPFTDQNVPDVFLKNIPEPKLSTEPDFVPSPKEPLLQESKETKNTLEKELSPKIKSTPKVENDPYKEPIE